MNAQPLPQISDLILPSDPEPSRQPGVAASSSASLVRARSFEHALHNAARPPQAEPYQGPSNRAEDRSFSPRPAQREAGAAEGARAERRRGDDARRRSASNRPDRPDRPDRPERPKRPEPLDRSDKPDQVDDSVRSSDASPLNDESTVDEARSAEQVDQQHQDPVDRSATNHEVSEAWPEAAADQPAPTEVLAIAGDLPEVVALEAVDVANETMTNRVAAATPDAATRGLTNVEATSVAPMVAAAVSEAGGKAQSNEPGPDPLTALAPESQGEPRVVAIVTEEATSDQMSTATGTDQESGARAQSSEADQTGLMKAAPEVASVVSAGAEQFTTVMTNGAERVSSMASGAETASITAIGGAGVRVTGEPVAVTGSSATLGTAAGPDEATDAGDPIWRQVRRALGSLRATPSGEQQITIRLRPAELGSVLVRISTGESGTAVVLVADSAAAASQLQQQRQLLVSELEEGGLVGIAVDVATGGETGQSQDADLDSDSTGSSAPTTDADGDVDNDAAAGHRDRRVRTPSTGLVDLDL